MRINKTKIGILLSFLALMYSCKPAKTVSEGNTGDQVVIADETIEDLATRIAERKAQFEKDSIVMAQKKASLDNYLKSGSKSSDTEGILIIEKKEWIDSINGYILDKKAFEEDYPIVKLKDNRKNDLFYRYFYGDPFALEQMIAIIENGNTDSINTLYRDLNEYKSGFDEEKLFSDKQLSSLIIESLNDEKLENNAIAIVTKLNNGTEILENRLESGISKYPANILFRLSFDGQSEIGLKYLDKAINDSSNIKLSNSQIIKDLENYLKFGVNDTIRQQAVQLGIDIISKKSSSSAYNDLDFSPRNYEFPTFLNHYILKYGDQKIIPFLLQLRNDRKVNIIEYKLWELGYDFSEVETNDLLENKELMVLMLKNDPEKRLLKEVDDFYEKLFKGILSSNQMTVIGFWTENLHNVVYYFKDVNKDVFENKVKAVLKAENKSALEESEMLSKIMELFSLANESKMDVLDYFNSIGYITSEQYKQVAKEIINENYTSKSVGDNYYDVTKLLNKSISFNVDGYQYVFERIRTNHNELFNNFSLLANTIEVEGNYGSMEEEPTEIIIAFNEKVYVMVLEDYSPEPYCSEWKFQDKFIHFTNYILEQNRIKNRIVPYVTSAGCEFYICYIGTPEQVEKIVEKYYFITSFR